jgi:diguanylate cyclase (GGDEF)-like protein
VIDDDALVLEVLSTTLTDAGFHVISAANGREGLQALLQHDCDVALVDWQMPEMDGVTFVREARKIWPWMGIVMASGIQREPPGDGIGISHFLIKPLLPDQVVAAVRDAAADARTRGGAQSESNRDLRRQMRILRQSTDSALAQRSFEAAFHDFVGGLGGLLRCDAVGVLYSELETPVFIIRGSRPLGSDFVTRFRDEVLREAGVLGMPPIDKSALAIQYDGPKQAASPDSMLSLITVPVIVGGRIVGLIAAASSNPGAFEHADVSFVYHVANHFATVSQAFNRFRDMAIRDDLTGMYNRRFLDENLRHVWLLSQRNRQPLSFIIMDLDSFKLINDTHGHRVGDQVLCEAARIIQASIRSSDIAARLGGDEFAVILPETDPSDARIVCRRILTNFRMSPVAAGDRKVTCTVSIGLASCMVEQMRSYTDLVQEADGALYAAKRAGKNQFAQWTPTEKAADQPAAPQQPAAAAAAAAAATGKGSVLVVDDEKPIRDLVMAILTMHGYEGTACATLEEAMETLRKESDRFDIVLTDLNLGDGASGFQLLEALRSSDESSVRIVMTGFGTKENAVTSLRHEAFDIVEKPISHVEMGVVLDRAMRHRRLIQENRRYQTHLENMVRTRNASLTDALSQLRQSYRGTIEALAAMIDMREHSTSRHSRKVRDATLLLARAMDIDEAQTQVIGDGALLHDIGKIAVPDVVLLKPGPLTDEEMATMRGHAQAGYAFLIGVPFLREPAEIVHSHHERYDGAGYPRGLKGEAICIGARIFAVVDAYDAMRSDRCYRKALPESVAIQRIQVEGGRQFDPKVVAAFMASQPEIETLITNVMGDASQPDRRVQSNSMATA